MRCDGSSRRADDDDRSRINTDVQVDWPDYRSTRLRAPGRPLVLLPGRFRDIGGPVFGEQALEPGDSDLTTPAAGEPLGERIIVQGRVTDEDGRPIAGRPGRGLAGERSGPLPP